MHIHHNPMASGGAGAHAAGAAEKAAAARRAEETRRKLLKSSAQIDGELDAGGLFMVGSWAEGSGSQRGGHPPNPQPNRHSEDDEGSGTKPISVWA
jgi:hypothetical protein